MKKVLVIMATYNGEKYLHEQIESILNQEDVKVLILARDDGSIDKTCDILNKYQKEKKLQWYTGEHLNVANGYFDLMYKAVDYDVDYISFSDQDDVWDSNKLKIAIEKLLLVNSRTPALYYSGQRLVDNNLNFIADHSLNNERSLRTRFVLSDFAGCTGIFNKVLLNEVVSYKPEYILMHDTWILKICLGLGGEVYVDSTPHMSYRQHGGNAVGLGRSLTAYLKQVRQYLCEYKVEPQMVELVKGYGDRLVPEYKELAECICRYRTDNSCKKKLLDKRIINFCNRGLNLTYNLKVRLNKL